METRSPSWSINCYFRLEDLSAGDLWMFRLSIETPAGLQLGAVQDAIQDAIPRAILPYLRFLFLFLFLLRLHLPKFRRLFSRHPRFKSRECA